MTHLKKEEALKVRGTIGLWRIRAIQLSKLLACACDQSKPETLGQYLRSFNSFMRHEAEQEFKRQRKAGSAKPKRFRGRIKK